MRLHFDDAGDIIAASAEDRPRALGNGAVATPFAGEFGDYEVFGGVRLPTIAVVRWEFEDGPFVYFRGRITSFARAQARADRFAGYPQASSVSPTIGGARRAPTLGL
jgi:hypothetical protein